MCSASASPSLAVFCSCDALSMEFRVVKTRRNPACPLCGDSPTVTELIDYEVFCGLAPAPEAEGAAVGH